MIFKNKFNIFAICLIQTFFIFGCQHKPSIDREEVRKPVADALPKFVACYSSEQRKDPALEGKAVLVWQVKDDGTAQNVRVAEDKTTIKNETLKNCLINEMSKLKFPAPPKGQITEVTYPFIFSAE